MMLDAGCRRGRAINRLLGAVMCCATAFAHAAERSGTDIMNEYLNRHQLYPYVYEEQTMVLMDAAGNRDVRSARRYSRAEVSGSVNFLLVFDPPPGIRGVALLAQRDADGVQSSGVYLPAFGKLLKSSVGDIRSSNFPGH